MWVIVALASLAALIILALCVPLDVELHLDGNGRPKFGMRLTWLFGLVSREVRRGKKKPEEEKREDKRKLRGRGTIRAVFKILRTRGLPRRIMGLLRDILPWNRMDSLW